MLFRSGRIVGALGGRAAEQVTFGDITTGAESEIAAAGIFPFIGVEPNTAFLPAAMRIASGHMTSTDPRIIAVGAVRADYGGMAAQAMAEQWNGDLVEGQRQ